MLSLFRTLSPCFCEKFFRVPASRPDERSKTSLRIVGVDDVSASHTTRASFLFCRNYFPGKASCLISVPHWWSARRRRTFSFVLFPFVGSVAASLRKLFHFWREYDTSESTEASAKEHGNAFCPCFSFFILCCRPLSSLRVTRICLVFSCV